MVGRVGIGVFVVIATAATSCRHAPVPVALGAPASVAPGIDLFQLGDDALVDGAGPIAVYLLRLDPVRVRLAAVLADHQIADEEPVDAIARRTHAAAAVNGGYFNRANGDPMGLLKVSGELVSDSTLLRGAILIDSPLVGRTDVTFDQLAAKMEAHFTARGHKWIVPVDGVDTTRERGHLMLYTPSYRPDTDTAPTGTEWVLDGDPLRVSDVRSSTGSTPIPTQGLVLSFGGVDLPEALLALAPGVTVTFETLWKSTYGTATARLSRADHIVSGAGLLRHNGADATDWRAEGISAEALPASRDPRTFVADDARGFIWLGVVDGRQPAYSVGMTFTDLQRLCARLDLRDALNLDGGGSTTMVVNGAVLNRPSDPDGPRPVSDAIVATVR